MNTERPATPIIDGLGLSIDSAGPADREEQARLFRQCFKKPLETSELRWRYDQNPHGEAVSLLLRPPAAEAIVSFAYMPRLALSHGDTSTLAHIGQQGDVMTHPDWRRKGLCGELSFVCGRATADAGWPMNWGFPNRQSASVFLKVGWRSVGKIRPWSHFLRADVGMRKERFREGRRAALGLPLAIRRCRAGRRQLQQLGAGRYEVRPIERFPAEVGALSQAVEQRFALMVRRDAAYLNWRFLDTPSGLQRALGVYLEGKLAGYVVVQRPRDGEAVGFIVDLLAPEESAVAAALAAGLDELEQAGAGLVRATAVDGSWWQGRLASAGFLAPKPDNHLFVYVSVQNPDHPLMAHVDDASKWYLTDGDRDDEAVG